MKRPVDKTMRPIRAAMIDQSADNAQTPIGITLLEKERIRCEVLVKFDLAQMMGILLPAFEPFQTLVERLVVDTFGILHYFIVVLLTYDFHNSPNFSLIYIATDEGSLVDKQVVITVAAPAEFF